MAHVAHSHSFVPALAPRAVFARVAAYWAAEDGFRHATYISAGLFITISFIKLVMA